MIFSKLGGFGGSSLPSFLLGRGFRLIPSIHLLGSSAIHSCLNSLERSESSFRSLVVLYAYKIKQDSDKLSYVTLRNGDNQLDSSFGLEQNKKNCEVI